MNCNEVETALPELARGSQDNPVLGNRALLHASWCGNCGTKLESEQILQDLLGALRIEMQPETAPPQVERLLLSEFKRRHQPATQLATYSRRNLSMKWVLAAAAAILMTVGLVLAPTAKHPEYLKAGRDT